MTATSARWPTTRRPRSIWRVESAGPTHAARRARSRLSDSCGSERRRARRPARILATDGERDPGPRVERLDRRVGAEREDGAGRRERAPRVAVGLGARAPQHPGLRRVAPEMDRLDAGHDAGRGEPAAISRIEQLDVLDLGHERDARRRRLQGVEGGPHGRVADGMDLGRDAAGGCSFDELAETLGLGVPDAAPQLGRERTVRLGLDVGEERRGPRPERPVGEALHPADARPAVRIVAEHRSAAEAAGERRLERVVAQRRHHAEWQPAGLRQARIGRIRPVEVGVGCQSGRVVDLHDAEAEQLERDGDQRRLQVRLGQGRDGVATSRVADSSRTPSGSPSGVRRMTPPDGSDVSRVTPAASRPAWLTRRA